MLELFLCYIYKKPLTRKHSMNWHGVDNQFREYYHNLSQSCLPADGSWGGEPSVWSNQLGRGVQAHVAL